MLNKIILGTANFTQSYGILSKNKGLSEKEITSIIGKAINNGVTTLDTALGYGNLSKVISFDLLKKFKIVTKISVLDSKEALVEKMIDYHAFSIYGLLIHDPVNITRVDEMELLDKLNFLKKVYRIEKIGISAYDIIDIENFSRIYTPEIVQIPLNPFNQSFDCPSFILWVQKNKIEVHARSLFLQGIFLVDKLPGTLKPLWEEWRSVQKILESYESPLHGLLLWAASKHWIHNWVLGVSSLMDLDDIFKANSLSQNMTEIPTFQPSVHPLADPRNW